MVSMEMGKNENEGAVDMVKVNSVITNLGEAYNKMRELQDPVINEQMDALQILTAKIINRKKELE